MLNNKTTNQDDLKRPRIGIDLLGCDLAERHLLQTLLNTSFEGKHPPYFIFYGTTETFSGFHENPDCSFHLVTEVIQPEDAPLTAIRTKKDSSLIVGIKDLKEYNTDAFITAGNSGSLLAASTLNLSLLPKIDRPGFITLMPTKEDPIAVIDVGANVSVEPKHLLQFAKMGIAYQKSRGIEKPTVGLLNIGEEKKKGTPKHQEAYKLLRELNDDAPLDAPVFIGNIEGRDVFRGAIDVLVTDGFTGNVFLKTSEGIAGFILDQMENVGPLSSIPGVKSMIDALHHRLHFAQYPGALLCGVEGIVIKCHGASTPDAFVHSIHGARHLVKNFFLEKIRSELGV